MSQELAVAPISMDLQEKALLGGDLSKLSSAERLSYYNSVCTSLGLNPLTRPFEYITLNGKLTLYARKDCTEQLRTNRCISVKILSREVVEGVYVVTAQAIETVAHHERTDESIGAVPIANLQGDAKANAMMKAETKAKRRVTLSICGLGMLDELELETIPSVKASIMDHKREASAKLAELKGDATTQPGAAGKEEMEREDGNLAAAITDSPQPPASSFFDQTSRLADWRTAMSDETTVAGKQTVWDKIVKDEKLTSEERSELYGEYQKQVKQIRKR